MNKMNEFYERYRKEKRIPKWRPHHVPYYMLSTWAKRNIKHNDGFRAYKREIEEGFETMPNNYDEFKRKMRFYYGWDFSTKMGDQLIAA